ncbi:lasso peptide biosynthesis B2 protein [Merismopedia glauca]|uniref:Microcin J25-processing protein McjB C-terminal domain-containing protein n=1 Tax=Merismopedia glauca CCAP 1448/3 TaxID=1296344 RepID=A0A2T1C2C6_9CYAN|nr:lasso peptide biosynthesis B2 protein [Merismopedia glauca]PSB02273.1 hypothetical protein C7B64_13910 [Merismopedia glauca CCAP 1448/3]
MRKLRKIWQISMGDRWLLLQATLLLTLVRLSLWLLPFKIWRSLLAESTTFPVTPQLPVGKITWAVNLVSSQMPGGVKCLARALTTHVLMTQYGHIPKLKIGVAKGGEGQLEAHAWVENPEGKIVIGWLEDIGRYLPLPSLQMVNKF